MTNWFVAPVTTRLDLGNDQWIEIKERLDFGETQALAASSMAQAGNLAGGEAPTIQLDLVAYKLERICAYVLDWSARDVDGRAVPVTRATIKALNPAMATAIDVALDAHIRAMSANPTGPTMTSTSP